VPTLSSADPVSPYYKFANRDAVSWWFVATSATAVTGATLKVTGLGNELLQLHQTQVS
jgi:hypothetical protein